MYIVPLAWLYVALMMAVAEATHSNGTLLGALITFVLYGLVPVALVVYLMGAPSRRRAIRAREAAELAHSTASSASTQPDAGDHAATDAVTPVRKEP
jgi:Na+/H+-dicarboxylate symporter